MARMSAGKSKKTTAQKGGVVKAAKLSGQSNKNARVPAEQNGSAPKYVASQEDLVEPVSMRESEEDRLEGESISDTFSTSYVSEDMNAAGTKVSEPDSSLHHRIAEHAFLLFQENGCRHGRDLADWFEAEREISQKFRSSRDD